MEIFLGYILPVLLFIVALALIIKGGDFLVNSAIWMAEVTKIPQMVIGATVVSIATTLPEVLVSTFAVAKGSAEGFELAVGNAAGSMIFNILVILGISAVFAPAKVGRRSFREKGVILTFCTVLLMVFGYIGQSVNVWEGAVLLVMFASFIAFNVYDALRDKKQQQLLAAAPSGGALSPNLGGAKISAPPEAAPPAKADGACADGPTIKKPPAWWMISLFFVGAAAIGVGAKLLVDNGMIIATNLGVSKEIVGLTFVAAGTSLPELVTTLTSIKRKTSSIGIGNVLGANIINSTLLVGLCGVMAGSHGLTLTMDTLMVTLPVMLLTTLLLVVPTCIKGRTYRWQGIAMLAVFAVYMTVMILLELRII